jgi:hypothetical protein
MMALAGERGARIHLGVCPFPQALLAANQAAQARLMLQALVEEEDAGAASLLLATKACLQAGGKGLFDAVRLGRCGGRHHARLSEDRDQGHLLE